MKLPSLFLAVSACSSLLCYAHSTDASNPTAEAAVYPCDSTCCCILEHTVSQIKTQIHALLGHILSTSADEKQDENLGAAWDALTLEATRLHDFFSVTDASVEAFHETLEHLKEFISHTFASISSHTAYTEDSDARLTQFDLELLQQEILNLFQYAVTQETPTEI